VGDVESNVFEREPQGGRGAAPQPQLGDGGAAIANPAVAELEAAFTTTGVLLPEQAILLQLLRAQGTQIAELAKVEASDRGAAAEFAEDAMRSVVARLTEAPTNWHQSTPGIWHLQRACNLLKVSIRPHLGSPRGLTDRSGGSHPRSNVFFFALDQQDADALQCTCGLLVGAAMVALQILVVIGVLIGTSVPACGSSDQCPQAGTYCQVGARDRCEYCGAAPLPPQTDPTTGGVWNDPSAPDFAGFNLTAVAALCADPSMYGDFPAGVVSWCKSPGGDAPGRLATGRFLVRNSADRRRGLRPPDRWYGGPADPGEPHGH
jgi:hypothetical protein